MIHFCCGESVLQHIFFLRICNPKHSRCMGFSGDIDRKKHFFEPERSTVSFGGQLFFWSII